MVPHTRSVRCLDCLQEASASYDRNRDELSGQLNSSAPCFPPIVTESMLLNTSVCSIVVLECSCHIQPCFKPQFPVRSTRKPVMPGDLRRLATRERCIEAVAMHKCVSRPLESCERRRQHLFELTRSSTPQLEQHGAKWRRRFKTPGASDRMHAVGWAATAWATRVYACEAMRAGQILRHNSSPPRCRFWICDHMTIRDLPPWNPVTFSTPSGTSQVGEAEPTFTCVARKAFRSDCAKRLRREWHPP